MLEENENNNWKKVLHLVNLLLGLENDVCVDGCRKRSNADSLCSVIKYFSYFTRENNSRFCFINLSCPGGSEDNVRNSQNKKLK
jgi:hypothetical protein